MIILYFHNTDKSYDSDDDIPISQLVLKRKALGDEQEEDEEEEDESSSDGNYPGLCSLCFHYVSIGA